MSLEEIVRGLLKPVAYYRLVAPHILSQHGHGYAFTTRELETLAEQQSMA
ncbi:MAG: hypothetical protein JRJ70_16745 [Deltaproteobacteria bacterium]|nr:hypothetical protein [Deltaproteobacteria bacterium]